MKWRGQKEGRGRWLAKREDEETEGKGIWRRPKRDYTSVTGHQKQVGSSTIQDGSNRNGFVVVQVKEEEFGANPKPIHLFY